MLYTSYVIVVVVRLSFDEDEDPARNYFRAGLVRYNEDTAGGQIGRCRSTTTKMLHRTTAMQD